MRTVTKKLNVLLTAESLSRALKIVNHDDLVCLISSGSKAKNIMGVLGVSSLILEHFMECNAQMYLIPRHFLTDVSSPGYNVLYEEMREKHGYWYQAMMQIGAIHLPSSIESVWLPMAASHLLAWSEPNVKMSGLASVGRELRRELLRLSPEKAVIPQSPGSTKFVRTVRSEARALKIIEAHGFLLNPRQYD